MIAIARKKRIYDATEVAEACNFLEATPQKFELFIAADVVVYFGDLSRLLRGIGAAASHRALVVFSTEKHDWRGYVLRDTGRYAHAPPDVVAWSQKAGFTVLAHEKATIRTQTGDWTRLRPAIRGWLAGCRVRFSVWRTAFSVGGRSFPFPP